jgi:hypothetical protein
MTASTDQSSPVADAPGSSTPVAVAPGPSKTQKAPLPYGTIVAATAWLLLPLAAVAALFWATRSTSSDDELSAEAKLRELQATEERQLTTYDWIEKPSAGKPGVVRVPVQRARELILSEMAVKQKENKK